MDIKTQLQNLLKLQELDNKLSELNQKKDSFPAKINEIKRSYTAIEEKQKQIEEQKGKSLKERKKLDAEIADNNSKLVKYQEQLMEVKTNKEYSSMLSEIENLKEKNSVLEDKVLESMEFIDVYDKQLQKIKEEALKVKEKVEEKIATINRRLDEVNHSIEKYEKERNSLLKGIDANLFHQYEKISIVRGDKVLSRANDSSCEGCHSIIRPHVLDQIREMKEIVFCERCQRILYWDSSILKGTS